MEQEPKIGAVFLVGLPKKTTKFFLASGWVSQLWNTMDEVEFLYEIFSCKPKALDQTQDQIWPYDINLVKAQTLGLN